MPQRHHSAGFTLIEGLVAIAMLGIVAGLGLPQLNGLYERQKLTNTANEVVTRIESAQALALANNQDKYRATPPLSDCVAGVAAAPVIGQSYVGSIRVVAVSNGNSHSYRTERVFRTTNAQGATCPPTGATQGVELINAYTLPGNVQFSQGGSTTGQTIVAYETTTGKATIGSQLSIKSSRFSTVYNICVKSDGRTYISENACS